MILYLFLDNYLSTISEAFACFILMFIVFMVVCLFIMLEFNVIEKLKWKFWDMHRIAETLWNRYTT